MTVGGDTPRTAYVTGASSGFGAAIARSLGGLGWRVGIGARRLQRLQEVARDVEKAGGRSFAHRLDVSDPDSVDSFFTAAEASLGPCEVLVSNAGTALPGLLHEVPLESLRTEIETNLFGSILVARRALPEMLAAKGGDIVFITSQNTVLPRPFQAGYTATKSGVEALARVLQLELEGTGVRSTIVRPGPSMTELGMDWDGGLLQRIVTLWERFGLMRHRHYLSPENVAGAVVAAVTAPQGTHLDLIQVNPQAPVAGNDAREG